MLTRSAHEDGREMQVNDQFGKPTDFFIRFVGVDSKTWQGIKLSIDRARMNGDEIDIPALLARAVIDWRGLDQPFTPDTAVQLLSGAPYIAEQANMFIGSRVNFLKESQTM